MYLDEPEQGGGTTFPDVQPRGRAQARQRASSSATTGPSSTRTLHGGAPVLAGEKWIATKWLREREFDLIADA